MGTFMTDELFEAQLVRALGYAPYSGADIGECLATAARIRKVDSDLWYSEWFATALRIRNIAEISDRKALGISGPQTTSAPLAFF